MILAAVCLGLASVGVALLRRGRFGRRLIALRDSEAAYAMLGGNLLLAKVAVFALAAGIAGLGGALYAMQQQSITSTQFSFEAGLAIFLIAVVGGVASVGGGFFAGAVLIGPINALVAVAAVGGRTRSRSSRPGRDGLRPVTGRHRAADAARLGAGGAVQVLVAAAVAISAAAVGAAPGRRGQRLGPVLGRGGRGGRHPRLRGRARGRRAVAASGPARLRRLPGRTGRAEPIGHPSPSPPPSHPHRRPRSRPAEAPVPVEWWGLSRPWRAEDEEVLDRAIARG